ncbi:MAG: AAA family ATPase [Myxococcales bacterium]|nr:AAA family ATPase [Myxococcales bacterium]MDD9967230.1 AAA family ATPase [Myxococcales bacterium]
MRFGFGEFVLDLDQRALSKSGVELSLEPKVFECLALLVSRAGQLTTMAQLRSHLWPDVSVADGALRRVINEARKVLGDSGTRQSQIRTRKGVGYLFVAPVTEGVGGATPLRSASSWPFVGREAELQRLAAWLSTGKGGLCLLAGEAGAGKSSLIAQLRASTEAGPPGVRWLTSVCPAALGLPAYWPFRRIVSQLVQGTGLRGGSTPCGQQGLHAPFSLPDLSGSMVDGSVDPQGQFELCEAFGASLAELSCNVPLCLVIEDLHCADAGSIAMLDAVARAASGRPLHVFATYRPESVTPGRALSQFIGRTSGRQGVISQHLDVLRLDDVRQLLRALALPGWAGSVPEVLRHMTGGNALFLSEWIRHALVLQRPLDVAPPPSVAHIVEERVRVLPEPTRTLLGQAAVLGRGFDTSVLAMLAGCENVDELLAHLEPAHRAGVVARDPEHADRWLFSHALVGDALVESLPLQARTAYHRQALRAFQALHGESALSGVLAAHAFESGTRIPKRARRELCDRAGREAFASHAFDQAVLQLGRAIQLLEPDDRSESAVELTLLWARARWHADDPEHEIAGAFLQAAELARRAKLPALFAQAAVGYALGEESSVHLRSVALRPEALELLEEAWTSLVQATQGDVAALAGEVPYRLAAALCWMRCEAGPLEEFRRAARRALELAPTRPDPSGRLWLLALRGVADAEQVAETYAAGIALLKCSDLTTVQRIDGWLLNMGQRLAVGDLAGYRRAVREVTSLVDLLPQPARVGRHSARLSAYIGVPYCARGTLAVMRGEFDEAERAFRALGRSFERLGLASTPEQANHMFCMLLWLYGYQGRAARLEPLVDRHLAANPDAHWFCSLTKTQFALERGERTRAGEHFQVLRESRFRPHLRGKPLLAKPETLVRAADACVQVGAMEDAAILYDALLSREGQCIQDGALICLGSSGRVLGELALMLGKHEDADRHFQAATAQNERLGHQPETVRTQLGWAPAMLLCGRASRARALVAQARVSAQRLGMAPALARAQRLVDQGPRMRAKPAS